MFKRVCLVAFILFFCSLELYAYSDSDMDGVDDKEDLCPDTSFVEIVNEQGCTIERLTSPHHFALTLGESYTKQESEDFFRSNLQLDYFYKSFTTQLLYSYYNPNTTTSTKESRLYFSTSYQYGLTPSLSLELQSGLFVETTNGQEGYLVGANTLYCSGDFFIPLGLLYTKESKESLGAYFAYNGGVGYLLSDSFYTLLSGRYLKSLDSYFEDSKALTLLMHYMIDDSYALTLSFGTTFDETKEDNLLLNIGYYW